MCCNPPPCCCGPNFPFATVTMTCPPPIILPTVPTPVKPLQLPCICPQDCEEYNENDRFDNYYNNYNVDWRNPGKGTYYCFTRFRMPGAECGVTVDGKSPILANRPLKECIRWGCPRGFKPTMMKMRPPPLCDPCGVWCAEVQECPPKRPKCHPDKSNCCSSC